MKRLVSESPDGFRQYHDFDHQTGTAYRVYEQDCEAGLEYSKALAKDTEYAKRGIKNDMQHVAHYSAIVCMKMMTEHGVNPYTDPAGALKCAKVHFPYCIIAK